MTQLPPPFDTGGLARFEGEPETPLLRNILAFVREERDPAFTFLRRRTIPWTPLACPLLETRVALLTTATLHRRGDEPFRTMVEPFGDTGHRVVPHATTAGELDLQAPYVDTKFVVHDPEVALPLRALDALARRGRVAGAAAHHHSFSGGVLRPFPGLRASVAEVAQRLRQDGAGAVVLAPTCSICVHTVALLAGELEELGFPTVALSLLPELSSIVGVPRTLTLRFPFGAPFGDPHHPELHEAVLDEALGLFETAEPGEVRASKLAWRRGPQ